MLVGVDHLARVDRSAVDCDTLDNLLWWAIDHRGLDRTGCELGVVHDRLRCVWVLLVEGACADMAAANQRHCKKGGENSSGMRATTENKSDCFPG